LESLSTCDAKPLARSVANGAQYAPKGRVGNAQACKLQMRNYSAEVRSTFPQRSKLNNLTNAKVVFQSSFNCTDLRADTISGMRYLAARHLAIRRILHTCPIPVS